MSPIQTVRRVRFSAKGALAAGGAYGLALGVIHAFLNHAGTSPMEKLGVIAAAVLIGAATTLLAKELLSLMPSGGYITQLVLGFGGLAYLLGWSQPWVRWLVIPTIPCLLAAFVMDYQAEAGPKRRHT
ncbi:MAG TPA: hypothetical protein VMT30_07160 [Candidatus Saccharimonadia bacterium]|nr:hypothetical protein [Candidatus Saccharimonadia bacterium]